MKSLKRSPLVLVILAACLSLGAPVAAQEGEPAPSPTEEEQEKAALEALAALKKDILDRYVVFEKAQEPNEENKYTYGQYYANLYDPKRNPRILSVDLLVDFEKKQRGNRAGLEALLTAVRYLRYNRRLVETKGPALVGLVFDHYLRFEQAGDVCTLGNVLGDTEAYMSFLDRMIEKTEHASVKAKAWVAKLVAFGSLGNLEEQRKCIDVLRQTYPKEKYKNTPCGELAERWSLPQHAKKALAVGEAAPEILGYDADGRRVALRDFRGKVVALVYWGWW
ncbi:MAG: hypothetical protein ACYTHM_13095 [Planctomycetota bacterium]|jgi:hypothetical protein